LLSAKLTLELTLEVALALALELALDMNPPGLLADRCDGREIAGAQRSVARSPARRRTRRAAVPQINGSFLGQFCRIPQRVPDTAKMFRWRRPTITLD
jgi:hypothetical protein